MKYDVEYYFNQLCSRYPNLSVIKQELEDAFLLLVSCFEARNKLLLCGNGGSQADADHIVGELVKGFHLKRRLSEEEASELGVAPEALQKGLPSISLAHPSTLFTAFINDVSAEMVYAQSVYVLGNRGDVLWAISTSGNAQNVYNAAKVAKAKGMNVLAMTGSDGGRLASICDVCIKAPAQQTFEVQELHLPIYHALCAMLEMHFFGEDA